MMKRIDAYRGRCAAPDEVSPHRGESTDARARRLEHERKLIAEADAEIAAGWVYSEEEADAWLDARARGEDLPLPLPKALQNR